MLRLVRAVKLAGTVLLDDLGIKKLELILMYSPSGRPLTPNLLNLSLVVTA
jgi:hypothetical protein